MTDTRIVEQFSEADSVNDIWSAARQVMANRILAQIVDAPMFLKGFDRLQQLSTTGSALDRLLALDLLIRLPAASKKLADRAQQHLRNTLKTEIPPLNILNDSFQLPDQAKPADIRENIATGLMCAQGAWVKNYLLTAIVNEHQSQRTRDVLLKELVTRSDCLSNLIHDLISAFEMNTGSVDEKKNAYLDLASICQSLTTILSQDRQIIEIGASSPKALDLLTGSLITYSGKGSLPPKLEDSAVAIVRLLYELLITEVRMFVACLSG